MTLENLNFARQFLINRRLALAPQGLVSARRRPLRPGNEKLASNWWGLVLGALKSVEKCPF